MSKTTFGKTGFTVSRLGFGAAPAAFLKADRDSAAAMLSRMLDLGMNLIDTATAYPGSHEFLGEYLSGRRKDFVLVSKCGNKSGNFEGDAWSAQLIRNQIDGALKNLRTDVIDVMLLHSCDLATLQKEEALAAIEEARKAGKIKFGGYSGDNEAAAWAAARPEVSVIETSVNIVDQRNIDLVLPACVKHNIGVLAKRPVANAAWKGVENLPGMYQNYAKGYTERFAAMAIKPADFGITADDWAETALRFTLSQPGVHVAIVGTTNVKNFEANLMATDKGALPAETVQKFRAAFKKADPRGEWPGLT